MTTYTIRTPNPNFNGLRAGLVFQAGLATTDDHATAQYCAWALGYHVEPDPAAPPPPHKPKPKPKTDAAD